MPTAPAHIYEFGAFRLDTAERVLRRLDGTLVPLTPRVFKTLVYMVEHRSTVLDKERIMEAVWPDTIVEENNLAQAISKLRQIFGETPGADGYIVTVAGRGYRFVAELLEVVAEEKMLRESEEVPPVSSAADDNEIKIPESAGPSGVADPAFRPPALPKRSSFLAAVIVGVAIAGVAASLSVRYRSLPAIVRGPSSSAPVTALSSEAQIPEKSIAVLPFKNLSRDPDNAYFADGIQDEILTRLSKIADLKVISRTSTQHYSSAPENLPEIAKQLGAANILEGSVQKSGDAVRINVQLIKAANDSHIWADTFDRKLTDIFSVESDVAKAIAEKLQAKLTGQEEEAIAAKPTDNPEAYAAFLRGLAYSLKPANSAANSLNAQKYLREAVRLDPKFTLAWALLSSVDSLGYLTTTLERTVDLREEARQAAETALSLQPNLGEALLATGYYHYGCLKDYDTAIRYFEQARQLLPNDSRIPESLAYVTRRRGQWDRSEAYFNEAERLDGRNANLLTQHALSLMRLRRL